MIDFLCPGDHRPRLEVKYHTSDQDVIYGRTLTSSCSALFSLPGDISWILDIKPYGVEEIHGNDSRLEYSQGKAHCPNKAGTISHFYPELCSGICLNLDVDESLPIGTCVLELCSYALASTLGVRG